MRIAVLIGAALTAAALGGCRASPPPPAAGASPLPETFAAPETPLPQIRPVESGHGVLIFEPAPAEGVAAETARFGTGCARWLSLVVAGHPELGKTPSLTEIDFVRRGLGRSHLRETEETAADYATRLGATATVVSTISGGGQLIALRFQLLLREARRGQPAPIEIVGDYDQLRAALPDVAGQLCTALGVESPRVPHSPVETVTELIELGDLGWPPGVAVSEERRRRLEQLAGRSALAWIYLVDHYHRRGEPAAELVKQILRLAPENQLAWWAAASGNWWTGDSSEVDPELETALHAVQARYPNSSLLLRSRAHVYLGRPGASNVRALAQAAVERAPESAAAWGLWASACNRAVEEQRADRAWGAIAQPERGEIANLYYQEMEMRKRALALDDTAWFAWLALASTNARLRRWNRSKEATWKALEVAPTLPEAHLHAIKLFSPHWLNMREERAAVVRRLPQLRYELPEQRLWIAQVLCDHAFYDRARELVRTPEHRRQIEELIAELKAKEAAAAETASRAAAEE